MNKMKVTTIIGTVFLLIPTFIFGWTLSMYNKTGYSIQALVEYPGCRPDRVTIKPGAQANVDAKECLVNHIQVTIDVRDVDPHRESLKALHEGVQKLRKLIASTPKADLPTTKFPMGGGWARVVMTGNEVEARIKELEGKIKEFENQKPINKTINLDWRVSGHRDFSIAIEKLPQGSFGIQAKYGDQLWTQVAKSLETAADETKKAFEIAADETKKAFEKAGQEIRKGFEDFGTLIEKKVIDPIVAAGDQVIARIKDCADTVALGSEWAAKKAAYEGALGGLIATQEINKSDPFKFTIYATKIAAFAGLEAGKLGAQGLSAIVEGLGEIIGGGFNIQEVSFDVEAVDLAQGKLPLLTIKGVFLGKPCTLNFQFDVTKPDKSIESIVKELIKIIPGV